MDNNYPPQNGSVPPSPIVGTIASCNSNPNQQPGSGPQPIPYSYGPNRESHPMRTFFFIMFIVLFSCSAVFNCLFFGLNCTDLSSVEYASVHESTYSGSWLDEDKIAIINIDGTIINGEDYREQIDKAANDDAVKAVVLRVNSPGGTISGSDYIYHKLCELREKKPLVVSMGSLAASGGYYVSMAVGDEKNVIFAEPTTWTGSIGVIISRYDASELFQEKLGVKNDPIKSGTMKGMGSMMEPLTEEQRAVLQELVDDSFDQFKKIVQYGRPKFVKDPEALDKLATGQVYNTNQALKLGLIDKVGYLDDAIERAKELANLGDASVHVVEYTVPTSLMDSFMSGHAKAIADANPLSNFKFLMDAATPRAYYMWTAR